MPNLGTTCMPSSHLRMPSGWKSCTLAYARAPRVLITVNGYKYPITLQILDLFLDLKAFLSTHPKISSVYLTYIAHLHTPPNKLTRAPPHNTSTDLIKAVL